LLADFWRGKTVFFATLVRSDIPTAESTALAEMNVRRVGMIMGKNENAVALQIASRHLVVWEKGGH